MNMRKIAFILETRTDEYGYNIRGELISAAEGTKVIEYQYTQISNLCDSASLREIFLLPILYNNSPRHRDL